MAQVGQPQSRSNVVVFGPFREARQARRQLDLFEAAPRVEPGRARASALTPAGVAHRERMLRHLERRAQ